MSDSTLGFGTQLMCANAATNLTVTTSMTTIGNIISIAGPNISRDAVDVSTVDSTDKWREQMDGMIDPGDMTFEVNYDGASGGTANDLDTLFRNPYIATNSSTLRYWQIQFADKGDSPTLTDSRWYCQGFISELGSPQVQYDDKVTQSVTIKFSGTPVYEDRNG